jgi:hypothetical protein
MRARWTRLPVAAAAAVGIGAAGVFIGPSASATTPILVGSCQTTVQGSPGTPVELQPSAVLQPVLDVAGPLLAPTVQNLFASLPPIPIGALPTGTGTITGGQIANAVNAQLQKVPLLGTLLGGVQAKLASVCQIGMTGVNTAAGAVQGGAAAVASGARQALGGPAGASGSGGPTGGSHTGSAGGSPAPAAGPATGGAGNSNSAMPQPNSPVLGGLTLDNSPFNASAGGIYQLLAYDLASSPFQRYSGIPYAMAGLFVPSPNAQYGGNVPGYNPAFGVLGQPSGGSSGDPSVQAAGHADALHGPAGGGAVGLPLLLAVLALSGVTAALVRTWVLRRGQAA